MKQETFTDTEYSFRRKKTRREEFLEIMDEIIPWDEWVSVIEPYYPQGKRGRPPMGIEKMLRMYLLQIWFNLSDPATEDAIYDSYAMRKFTEIDFMTEAVPDETTLCKFRHLLEKNELNKLFFDAINRVMVQTGHKIIIPELHYNNAQMSQFYMRFVRYTSTEWKDIYFLTYEDSIEANLLQMVLAKERINLFMKGADADLDEVYKKFGVDYNLQAQLLSREADADGRMRIRWGQQQIA